MQLKPFSREEETRAGEAAMRTRTNSQLAERLSLKRLIA
jgi:hypothetical protein